MTRFIQWVLSLALLFAALVPSLANAHTRSESHSAWDINGSQLHMDFTVADKEVERLKAPSPEATDATLTRYLSPRISVSANGTPCKMSQSPRPVSAAAGYHRIEFAFSCPQAKGIVLHSDAFTDIVPTHVHFAEIATADGRFVEQLFTSSTRDLPLDGGREGRLADASFFQFVGMGIMHIFTGVDHMSFLVGLVLIARRLKDLTFVVTGFTLGHSLTLALAVTGVIRPHAEYIDALVALTIMLIGIENLAVASGKVTLTAIATAAFLTIMALLRWCGIGLLPPLLLIGTALFASCYLFVSGHLTHAGRLRLIITLVFGLIHGFGFAADLLESKIPKGKLAELLFGFNIGVEIGQLTIVLLLAGSVWALSRLRLTLPRPLVVDVAASALVGIGMFWFIGRSFSA